MRLNIRPLIALLILAFTASAQAAPRQRPARPADSATWVLSGYLAEAPAKKVYLTLTGKKIAKVSATAPAVPAGTLVIDTNDLIFPGLVDLHSHVKYNILPLWDLALGQFTNRFEWREKFSAYKDAVSFNMRPIKGDTVCAAVRWAELKALAGGTTALQGIGGDAKCAKDFGIHNIEIPGEFDNAQKIRAMTDMIMPGLIGSVYEPMIAPFMKNGSSYDDAYARMLVEQGVTDWVAAFVNEPHTVENGLKLLLGAAAAGGIRAANAATAEDFAALRPAIGAALRSEPFGLNAAAADKQLANMTKWLFGDKEAKGYLVTPATEAKAFEFLSKGGVLAVSSKVRRYIGMFEDAVRRSAIGYLEQPDALAIVAHLAEGQRNDEYNRAEFEYAKTFGLVRDGLVVIHGVGLDAEALAEAARAKVSIVWSPFSNLLLYGETLDVEAARKAGVNLAIGADWSPTGSRNLLGELKIARRYLDKFRIQGITDKDLVEMATVNAARALKRERVIGRVAEGYQADLLLVKKPARVNPYTALVRATQADVNLVVVSGQPLYGEPKAIARAAQAFGDTGTPEQLPAMSSGCGFTKGLRLPTVSDYNPEAIRSAAAIQTELSVKMAAYAEQVRASEPRKAGNLVKLDPIFDCEDAKYRKRFAEFVEKELDANAVGRSDFRLKAKLDAGWSPIHAGGDPDEEAAE